MAFEVKLDYQWLHDHYSEVFNYYFHQCQRWFYIFANNLAHTCDAYFSLDILTEWAVMCVLMWSIIYFIYSRITVVILKRMSLPLLYRNRLTQSLWRSGFSISCIFLCTAKLAMHEAEMQSLNTVSNSDYLISEEAIPGHILISCVVIFSFFIHSTFLSGVQKGLETEFFSRGLVITFLYAAYCLRYIWLAISFVVLTTACSLCIELMRVFYCLNQERTSKPCCLRYFVCILFAVHCVLWGGIFLYVLPKYYLLPTIYVEVPDTKLRTIIMLCGALWSYYWLEVCSSPAVKLMRYYLWPDYAYGRRDWLDHVLFPPRNDVIEHLKQIRSKVRSEQTDSQQYDYYKRKMSQENEGRKNNQNSVALFQTVKCMMAMKRRIKRRRAAKAMAQTSQVTSDNTSDTTTDKDTSFGDEVNGLPFASGDNSDCTSNVQDDSNSETQLTS